MNSNTLRLVAQEPESPYRVDLETGEIFEYPKKDKEGSNSKASKNNELQNAKFQQEGTLVPASWNLGYWIKADREFYSRMLKLDLPRNQRRVLDAMMVCIRFGNFVDVGNAHLCGLTGISKSHVSEAVTALIENDLCVRLRMGHYLLNPLYIYMGEGDGRASMIARYYEAKARNKARKRGP